MALQEPFSKRNRLITPKEITIREDAPETLRYVILDTARELEYAPSSLRTACPQGARFDTRAIFHEPSRQDKTGIPASKSVRIWT